MRITRQTASQRKGLFILSKRRTILFKEGHEGGREEDKSVCLDEVLVVFSRACTSVACQRPSTKTQSDDPYGTASACTRFPQAFIVDADNDVQLSRTMARATSSPCRLVRAEFRRSHGRLQLDFSPPPSPLPSLTIFHHPFILKQR